MAGLYFEEFSVGQSVTTLSRTVGEDAINTFAGLTAFTEADVDTKTAAVFGDFTYDFTDQFSLSLGGRYTWDKREASILRQNYLGRGSPVFGGAGVPFGAPGMPIAWKPASTCSTSPVTPNWNVSPFCV